MNLRHLYNFTLFKQSGEFDKRWVILRVVMATADSRPAEDAVPLPRYFFESEIKCYLCSYSFTYLCKLSRAAFAYHLFCLLYVLKEHIFWGYCVTAFFLRYLIFFLLRKLIQEIVQDSENAKIQLPDKSPVLLDSTSEHTCCIQMLHLVYT